MTKVDKNPEELQLQIQYALMEKLAATQKQQSQLLELLNECIFECNADLNLTYTNRAWETLLGYPQDSLLGKPLVSVISDELQAASKAIIEEWLFSANKKHSTELQVCDARGNKLWFELRLSRNYNQESGFAGLLYDIDNRKRLERQLVEREQKNRALSLVAKHATNLVIITDRKGLIVWVNSSFEKISGYNLEDVVGTKPGDFLQGPLTSTEKSKEFSAAIKNGEAFQTEIINYNREGETYWVSIDASPVFEEESGVLSHFIAIETDITQRVEAELAAAESEFNYRSVVDNINEVVLQLKPDGELLFFNHAWNKLIGISDSQSNPEDIHSHIESSHKSRVAQLLASYRTGITVTKHLDLQVCHTNGKTIWVEMTTVPVRDARSQKLISIATTLINIDSRVAEAEALNAAKQHAETLATTKSRFLANVSHEIRTPLNAILGASSLLEDTGLTSEQRRFADMVSTSGNALLGVLDDVLTYSRLEAGALVIEQHPFDLSQCLEEAIDIVAQTAVSKGLSLIMDVEPNVPLLVLGDKVRMRQVLINLLSNAIKFTEQGHIVLKAFVQKLTGAHFELMIQIEDSGIGIAARHLEELFQPFVQADVSTTRKHGGSGLGLAICSQICEAAGGSIRAESIVGKGSVFTVLLPLKISMEEQKRLPLLRNPDKNTIWIIGDDPIINTALSHLLTRHQLKYDIFNCVEDIPDNIKPPTIFAVTNPREESSCKDYLKPYSKPGSPPFLLTIDLTATGKPFEIFDSTHLHYKGPFKMTLLDQTVEVLDDMLGNIQLSTLSKPAGTTSKPLPMLNGKTVLVVEDNLDNQFVADQYLNTRECHVLMANHGEEALRILAENKVDLILMDIQMPVMDGLAATRHIRASKESYRNIPIIAVTADAVHGDRKRCLKEGMDDYLSKPLFKDELNRVLNKYLLEIGPNFTLPSKAERLINMQNKLSQITKA